MQLLFNLHAIYGKTSQEFLIGAQDKMKKALRGNANTAHWL